MKSAFAKLLQKDPVQSSHIDFRAGGNGVPILTRASGQSTAGYQTMGLPGGNKPYPGGGANKTTLGSIRMGDDEGNGPASAIVGGVGEIFFPFRAPDRSYPERTFLNVGNNVFQPENNDIATIALLKRLGDQKFKAESQAPFEEYRAQQRLARDLEEASRGASLADLGQSREIIRNLAEKRRQQNEDDYLRKMLDAGATPEAARKEIEDVRNANALQEARKVDDRDYQAKMLIQRMALARGITPMVREPLNQSSSIDNPQRSQAMSQAMGKPGEGFGTSPLDVNREFLTPDFYRKYLRRSRVSQEASDEAVAFNNALQGTDNQERLAAPSSGSFSLATLKGQERQQQIEMASEGLAARLEALRQRSNRIKLPLASPVFAEEIIKRLYDSKNKKVGDAVLYSPEVIQELNPLQLLLSINWSIQSQVNGTKKLMDELKKYTWGSGDRPSDNWLTDLKKVAYALNKNEQNVRIPFASASLVLPTSKIIDVLNNIKTGSDSGIRSKIERGRVQLLGDLGPIQATDFEVLPDVPRPSLNEVISTMAQPELPGAGRTVVRSPDVLPRSAVPEEVPAALTREGVASLTLDQVKSELTRRGINMGRKSGETSLKKLLRDRL